MPQPRSIRVVASKAASREARCSATVARVACSSPSGVKYIRAAEAPNFGSARRRLDLGEGRGDLLRVGGPAQLSLGVQLVALDGSGPGEQVLTVVRQQPPECLEVHPGILSAGACRTPALALPSGEC